MQIDTKVAKELYDGAPKWFQEKLEEEFGKDSFKKIHFTDIKTFEDACASLGLSTDNELFSLSDSPDIIAYKKLVIIVRAINQGWVPDWNDSAQKKWWPWFLLSSGFGFGDSTYYCAYTYAGAGSRLCFESKDKADYCAKQFLEIYKQFIL